MKGTVLPLISQTDVEEHLQTHPCLTQFLMPVQLSPLPPETGSFNKWLPCLVLLLSVTNCCQETSRISEHRSISRTRARSLASPARLASSSFALSCQVARRSLGFLGDFVTSVFPRTMSSKRSSGMTAQPLKQTEHRSKHPLHH